MKSRTGLGLIVLFSAAPAFAHPLHGAGGLAAGFAHPFLGLDHMLAMLAIGLWAAQLGARAVWAVPGVFMLTMLAGFGLGVTGFSLPGAEPMIAASLVSFGLLVAARAKLPAAAGMLIAVAFALSHGFAHAAEIPLRADALSYALGFACTTAALHALGLLLGRSLRARYLGVPIALAGALMLAQAAV